VTTDLATYDPLASLMDGTDVDGVVYKRVLYFGNLIEILKHSTVHSLDTIVDAIINKSYSMLNVDDNESFNQWSFINQVTTSLNQPADPNFFRYAITENIKTFFGIIANTTGADGPELSVKLTQVNTLKTFDRDTGGLFNVNRIVPESEFQTEINSATVGTITPPSITGVADDKIEIDNTKTGILHTFSYTSESDQSNGGIVIQDVNGYTANDVFEILNSTTTEFSLALKTEWLTSFKNGDVFPLNRNVEITVGEASYTFLLNVTQTNRTPTSLDIDSGTIQINKTYGDNAETFVIQDYFADADNDNLVWKVYNNDFNYTSSGEVIIFDYTDNSTLAGILGASSTVGQVDTFTCILKSFDGEVESSDSYVLTIECTTPLAPLAITGPAINNIIIYGSDWDTNNILGNFTPNDSTVTLAASNNEFELTAAGELKRNSTTSPVLANSLLYSTQKQIVQIVGNRDLDVVTTDYSITLLSQLKPKQQGATRLEITSNKNSWTIGEMFTGVVGNADTNITYNNIKLTFDSNKAQLANGVITVDTSQMVGTYGSNHEISGSYTYTGVTTFDSTSPQRFTVNFKNMIIIVPPVTVPTVTEVQNSVPPLPSALGGKITIPAPTTADILTKGSVTEKNTNRTAFISKLLKTNKASITASTKMVMSATDLGVDTTIITKSNVRVLLASSSNTNYPDGVGEFDVKELENDEGIYVHLASLDDKIIFTTVNGKKLLVKKTSLGYGIVEDYDSNINQPETSVNEGHTGLFDGLAYGIGSVTAQNNGSANVSAGPAVPICFPAGTPVMTNKGEVAIEKLNPDIHNIRGKRIVAITETNPKFKYIIRIEKDALGPNLPSRRTEISRDHEVFYKGKSIRSEDLVNMSSNVYRIKYHGETLYNVLLDKHDKMMVNNLICETLHPANIMAKICCGKYTTEEKKKIYAELNEMLANNDLTACKRLYASLK